MRQRATAPSWSRALSRVSPNVSRESTDEDQGTATDTYVQRYRRGFHRCQPAVVAGNGGLRSRRATASGRRARVGQAPTGPPCAVPADLLTGPVLTHDPAYHGRLIDGALGRGRCAAVTALTAPRSVGQTPTQARSATPAPAACAQGWAAVSSYDYTITDPTGAVTHTPRLAGHVLPGDTIRASFTVKPRLAKCATVRVSLATYAALSLAHDAHALSQQALYQSAPGLFGAGAHNLALRVDVPARPLAASADTPSPVRPRIAGGLVRRPLVFHDRARLLMRAVRPLD